MRYTRTALGLLNAQYRSVLKKCFMINMGLFALGANIGTANAATTLTPTLDAIKTAAQQAVDAGAISTNSYNLHFLPSGETPLKGAIKIRVANANDRYFNSYYFTPAPNEDAELLSILAGTPVATVDGLTSPTSISFNLDNITKIPSSVFKYVEGSESDYNFVMQEADASGNITKKYYKVVIDANKLSTSPNIRWEKVDGPAANVIEVSLPNNKVEYYKYTYTQPSDRKVYNTRQDSLSYDVNADFIGANCTAPSENKHFWGGAIYNSGTINSITGDFIGNYASNTTILDYSYVFGGAIYSEYDYPSIGIINSITGNFIGNYASTVSSNGLAGGGAIFNRGKIGSITGDFIGNYASGYYSYGGAIVNDNGTIGSITGDFIGNYASSTNVKASGGAISNRATIDSITGNFIGNYVSARSSANGGAIYNDEYSKIDSIAGDFIGNYASATGGGASGGAIYNDRASYNDEYKGTIGSIIGDFIGNYVSSEGGAIYNNGTINSIAGNFIGNYTDGSYQTYGGAIYNRGTITSLASNFIGNYASSTDNDVYGGAIYNVSNSSIGSINGNFENNYASTNSDNHVSVLGGAIYNDGSIGDISGHFSKNYALATDFKEGVASGGAIYNASNGIIGGIDGDFIGNHASNYSTYTVSGGAIYNSGTINGMIISDFRDNHASSTDGDVYGGAIYNDGTIDIIKGDFENNYASGTDLGNRKESSGGAIYNYNGNINNIAGDFIGNYVSTASSDGMASGGAIYNYNGNINNITGKFIGNYASTNFNQGGVASGGAIYNNGGTITFVGASEFTDNHVVNSYGRQISEAIYNMGTINFNSGDIVLNDAVGGSYGILNLTGQTIATANNDIITINNSVVGNTVNLTQGTLKLGHYNSNMFGHTVGSFSDGSGANYANFVVSGGKLTTQDGEINNHNLGNLTLNSDLNTSIDVDFGAKKGDVLSANTATSANGNKILIDNIKIVGDDNSHIITIKVADEKIKDVMGLASNARVERTSRDTNNYLIVYENADNAGNLKFGQIDALETAVQFENANKIFSMGLDIATDTDLGVLTGNSLSISGAGHIVDGSGFGGMTIAQNQTVSINDVTIKGFTGSFAENNGTLNIDASADNEVNLNSGISGNGTINATSEGTLNINSTINADTLNTLGQGVINFNDNIEADKMNVAGGELNLQNGTELSNVENFVANGGVLNVGDQTINLKNATFNDGSTVAINVKSDGNGLLKADQLTINGGSLKATLGQGLVEKGSKTVTLLESGTAFENNFADVMDNNMYRFEKADKAGDYIISLAKTAEEVSQENGGSSNNTNEAKSWVDGSKFEQGTVSADVADKLADLAQNDGKKFNEALTALAPNDISMVRTSSVNHNTEMFKTVVSHLEDIHQKHKFGLSSGDELDGVSVWAKAFGNHAKVDDTAQAYGFKSDGYGAILGIEKQLNDAFRIGVGYSYVYNDISGFMRDSDVDTHTGFVYGEYRPNDWYVNTVMSYGYSDYDETKHVAGDKYKAKYDVDNIGAQVMTGYNATIAKVDVTPETGLRYNNIHRDNYVDGAGQAVKAETMDVMTAVAGVKVGKDLVSCFGSKEFYWRPEARLAATYDVISDRENSVVSLSNGSGYVVNGHRLNRFGIEVGTGVTFFLTPDVESGIGYEGKFRKDYQDHTGYINAKYKF